MGTTILDIAKALGLSHTTVSRVLNGRQSDLVSEATKERVLKAAQDMVYRPNLAARSLRDTRSNLIGVFGSPFSGVWGHGAPEIVHGLSAVLHTAGYDLFFAFSEPEGQPDALPAWRFDGAIVVQAPTPATIDRLERSGQPVVGVNEVPTGSPAVLPDEAQGVRFALKHLADLGHKTVAYADASCWHFEHFSIVERRNAFLTHTSALDLRAIPLSPDTDERGRDRTAFLRRSVLEGGATAVLAYDHIVAIDILAGVTDLGLRVPQDVSLVCFNDEYLVSRLRPSITTLRMDGNEMGRQAGGVLLELLRGETPTTEHPRRTRIPFTLKARQSTASQGG